MTVDSGQERSARRRTLRSWKRIEKAGIRGRAMTAAEIAAALGGGQQSGSPWLRCTCPAHGSSTLSLAIRDGDSGRLVVNCWGGCDWRDVVAELQRLGLTDETSKPVPSLDPGAAQRREAASAANRTRRTADALDLFFNETWPAEGTIVERYLQSRGIISAIPPTIRVSARWLRHRESGETRPAMVSLVEHVEHGRVGCHLTYLAIDGSQEAA